MTDPSQPTTSHVSYGRQFHVSDDEDPFEECGRQTVAAAPSYGELSKPQFNIPPDFRIWEPAGRRASSREGATFKFRVLSYNVLAQYLLECHPNLYTDCAPGNLKWKCRASRLYDEIISYAPDILCLQEVEESQLHSFYSKFEEIGYKGIFKQKAAHRQDGCAIYFKRYLFDLKGHMSVEFYQPELPILYGDNIGIMVKLTPRDMPNSSVVVATTHLLYNPKRTDVRLAQMQVFLAEIDRFAFFTNGRESGYHPIILTGDFNSTPNSMVMQLLDQGHISAGSFRDTSDWNLIGVMDNSQHMAVYLNKKEGRLTDFTNVKVISEYCESSFPEAYGSAGQWSSFNSGALGHRLKLASVYDTYKSDGSCEATTHQDYWFTVDYMYYSYCNTMRLLERLRLPTAAECAALGRLPNDVYGSDHLALAATFELRYL